MEFTHEFRVPTDIDTTFDTLTDLEKVAPCLPGASLDEIDGESYKGQVKVRVGPMQMIYRGTARLVEADREARRGRIEATGSEARGAGTAKADVVATLAEDEGGTLVTIVTDLNVTGKPAQFGRGVLADVGSKIISTFADRLREMLEADDPQAAAADDEAGDDREDADEEQATDDALDLVEVARAATLKRVVPLVVGLVVVAAIIWWLAIR